MNVYRVTLADDSTPDTHEVVGEHMKRASFLAQGISPGSAITSALREARRREDTKWMIRCTVFHVERIVGNCNLARYREVVRIAEIPHSSSAVLEKLY